MTTNENDPLYLPEHLENPFIAALPPLMSQQQAIAVLSEEPRFTPQLERGYPDQLRRACIMRLNHHYFRPLRRHLDFNERIGQVLREGYDGRNISTGDYQRHLRDNYERVVHRDPTIQITSARSTATVLSLIGCSGMGKTETVTRILRSYPQIVEHVQPVSFQQLVWLRLECPHIGSARQLCLDFLSAIDSLLGTTYFRQFHRANLDMLSSQMGAVANRHCLGLLVIDELQNLLNGRGKDRDQLLNFLLNLVNKIGVPLLLVGTLAATPLLSNTLRNARRASGLGGMIWERLERQDGWDYFISDLWRFQWTREPTELTPEIIDCLYEETQGILDLAVKLFILSQFFAIELSAQKPEKFSREQLSVKLLRQVAKDNFQLLERMLGALKRGDREAIAQYDDLRPFHEHIRGIFYAAVPSGGGEVPPVNQARPYPVPQSHDAAQQVRLALAGLGVAPDIVKIILEKALAEVGSDDPIALTGTALGQLQGLSLVPSKPIELKREKGSSVAGKSTPELAPDDLRALVAQGQENGQSAYEALSRAGVIVPIDQLYRVSQ